MNMSDVSSQGDNVVIQNNDILLNKTQKMEDVSFSSPLTNSNDTQMKDPVFSERYNDKQQKPSHYWAT